jgi:glycosyltransferase involved in cell wall biosynthesis
MSEYPLVTIMIPTYNQSAFIVEAVESALMQDYENLEVIVLDDCSDDNTQKLLQAFNSDSRFYYHRNKKNIGRVKNYRKLLYELANGVWVVNLDGDDYYTSKSFISNAINKINKVEDNDDIVAYCYKHTNIEMIKSIRHRKIGDNTLLFSGKDYFINYPQIGDFTHMNTIYRREKALAVDCFTKPYQASDFESLIKVIITGYILIDSSIIGVWRLHSTNTTIKESKNQLNDIFNAYDDIICFAMRYFTINELNIWLENMKERSRREYISSYVKYNKGLGAALLLLKNIKLSNEYLRLWYIYLLR